MADAKYEAEPAQVNINAETQIDEALLAQLEVADAVSLEDFWQLNHENLTSIIQAMQNNPSLTFLSVSSRFDHYRNDQLSVNRPADPNSDNLIAFTNLMIDKIDQVQTLHLDGKIIPPQMLTQYFTALQGDQVEPALSALGICNCTEFGGNDFRTAELIDSLNRAIGHPQVHLQQLSLADCNIGEWYLLDSLANMDTLQQLELQGNQLTTRAATDTIGMIISQAKSLTHLNIETQGALQEAGIIQAIMDNSTLTHVEGIHSGQVDRWLQSNQGRPELMATLFSLSRNRQIPRDIMAQVLIYTRPEILNVANPNQIAEALSSARDIPAHEPEAAEQQRARWEEPIREQENRDVPDLNEEAEPTKRSKLGSSND